MWYIGIFFLPIRRNRIRTANGVSLSDELMEE
jgi:hypothetical protein